MSIAEFARRTSVHVLSAILVMGAWAAFANRGAGTAAMLRAASVQACASAFVTFTLKTSLERLARELRGLPAFVVPPAICSVVVLAILFAAHHIARTPHVWATIAVPYAASTAYAWIYAAMLAGHGGPVRG